MEVITPTDMVQNKAETSNLIRFLAPSALHGNARTGAEDRRASGQSHGPIALVVLNNHVLLCFWLRSVLPVSPTLPDASHSPPPTASSYFHLPIDEDDDLDDDFIPRNTRHISWVPADSDGSQSSDSASSSPPSSPPRAGPSKLPDTTTPTTSSKSKAVINEILALNDCYAVLGVSRSSSLDKLTLRRAYLARSKACHPE